MVIGESVFARCLSSLKSERVEASKVLKGKIVSKYDGDKKEFVEHIRKVLTCSQMLLHVVTDTSYRPSMPPR